MDPSNIFVVHPHRPAAFVSVLHRNYGGLEQARSTHSSRATWCYIACGDIQNEKMSFSPFAGKAKIECQSNFKNL